MSTRTITYTVKVDTKDGQKAARDMKVTMQTMSQDSTKAKASMDKLSNSLGKKLGVSVKATVDDTKSLSTSLRQGFSEAKKAEKNFNVLSREYKLLSSRVGRTADQQEQLNAIYRLGSTATLTQKKATLELVKAYQIQRAAGTTVQKSFRGMRGQMQNFGYQMQDVAVQMQMGTNAMTIFSQQGSQLAAGFGPTGAVIGAGIAFAGMMGSLLLPALFQGDKAVKNLTERLKELAKTIGLTKEQSDLIVTMEEDKITAYKKEQKELDEKIKQSHRIKQTYKEYEAQQKDYILALAQTNSKITEVVLTEKMWIKEQREAKKAQDQRISSSQEFNTKIKASEKAIKLATSAIGQGTDEQKKWAESNKDIVDSVSEQVEVLGLSNSRLLELSKTQKLKTLVDQKAGKQTIALVNAKYDELILDAQKVEMSQALSKEQSERNKQANETIRTQNAALAAEKRILNLRSTLTASGLIEQLRVKYVKEKALLVGHEDELQELKKRYIAEWTEITSAESMGVSVDELNAWKTSNKSITESVAKQVEQLGLTNSQLLELKKNQDLKTLADQEALDTTIASTEANYDALILAARRTEMEQELSKEIAERSKAQSDALSVQNEALAAEKKLLNLRAGLTDSGRLDQLRSQYEQEKLLLAGHKEELEALEQKYERDRLQISGTAWEKYLDGLKNASMDFEKLSEDMLQGSIENLSDGIANAIVNADSLGEAFKNTFKAVAEAGISALIQMGVQRLIFSTLDTGLKAKETGVHVASEATKAEATMAAKVAEMQATKAIYVLNVYGRGMAEATLGSLNAAASTAAIPVVGPALAPAAAAAFMSFGTATVGTAVGFAGAFDKGGVIPQNQLGIVSEYGDELVNGVMVKGGQGGTRVTGREDTAKIMNNSGGNNTFNITSSGNVSPEAIARAVARTLKKPNKVLDTMVYDSVNRGSKNRGKRFA